MIKPVIGIGKNIPQSREFKDWLKSQGYEIDTWPGTERYVDAEKATDSPEAAEIWQSLWDQFKEA